MGRAELVQSWASTILRIECADLKQNLMSLAWWVEQRNKALVACKLIRRTCDYSNLEHTRKIVHFRMPVHSQVEDCVKVNFVGITHRAVMQPQNLGLIKGNDVGSNHSGEQHTH